MIVHNNLEHCPSTKTAPVPGAASRPLELCCRLGPFVSDRIAEALDVPFSKLFEVPEGGDGPTDAPKEKERQNRS